MEYGQIQTTTATMSSQSVRAAVPDRMHASPIDRAIKELSFLNERIADLGSRSRDAADAIFGPASTLNDARVPVAPVGAQQPAAGRADQLDRELAKAVSLLGHLSAQVERLMCV